MRILKAAVCFALMLALFTFVGCGGGEYAAHPIYQNLFENPNKDLAKGYEFKLKDEGDEVEFAEAIEKGKFIKIDSRDGPTYSCSSLEVMTNYVDGDLIEWISPTSVDPFGSFPAAPGSSTESSGETESDAESYVAEYNAQTGEESMVPAN